MRTGTFTKRIKINHIIHLHSIFMNRKSGKTTRLVDYYIQELFNNLGNPVEIIDEDDNHKELLRKILLRLKHEHHVNIRVTDNTLTIF
jgi:RNase H-fold protein (predicted Holliday junction resolvase)